MALPMAAKTSTPMRFESARKPHSIAMVIWSLRFGPAVYVGVLLTAAGAALIAGRAEAAIAELAGPAVGAPGAPPAENKPSTLVANALSAAVIG
jgi:hypothetical protein